MKWSDGRVREIEFSPDEHMEGAPLRVDPLAKSSREDREAPCVNLVLIQPPKPPILGQIDAAEAMPDEPDETALDSERP